MGRWWQLVLIGGPWSLAICGKGVSAQIFLDSGPLVLKGSRVQVPGLSFPLAVRGGARFGCQCRWRSKAPLYAGLEV